MKPGHPLAMWLGEWPYGGGFETHCFNCSFCFSVASLHHRCRKEISDQIKRSRGVLVSHSTAKSRIDFTWKSYFLNIIDTPLLFYLEMCGFHLHLRHLIYRRNEIVRGRKTSVNHFTRGSKTDHGQFYSHYYVSTFQSEVHFGHAHLVSLYSENQFCLTICFKVTCSWLTSSRERIRMNIIPFSSASLCSR